MPGADDYQGHRRRPGTDYYPGSVHTIPLSTFTMDPDATTYSDAMLYHYEAIKT